MGVMLHGGTRASRRARLPRPRGPHMTSTSPAAPGAVVGVSPRILAGFAVLLPLAFSTATYAVYWAPKATLVLLTLPAGIATLTVLARRRIPGARAAAGFVVVSGVSALISDRPILALVGAHNWGTGWLFVAALAGLWALGRSLDRDGARKVQSGIAAGVCLTAIVAWAQALLPMPIDALEPSGGRVAGLTGNPVHLGAVCGAGMILVGLVMSRSPRTIRWLPFVALLGGAVQLSGTRTALAVTVIGAVGVAIACRPRRGAAFIAALALGILVASVVPKASAGLGSETASQRILVSGDRGSSARIEVWRASIGAVADRPLLGWGPGRLQSAISPRIGPEVARVEGRNTEYVDAHNWIVEYAATTGIVGLGFLSVWVIGSGRRARGPLGGFALVGAAVGLLQPQSVAITPLIALALGAAGAAGTVGTGQRLCRGRQLSRAVGAATAGTAIVAGAFLVGEAALARAAVDFSPTDLEVADRVLPPWPVVHRVEWRILAFAAIDEGGAERWDRAIRAAVEAANEDAAVSSSSADVAALMVAAGRADESRRYYERALEKNPWSVSALDGLIRLAHDGGEDDLVAELCARRQEIVDGECLADVRAPPG